MRLHDCSSLLLVLVLVLTTVQEEARNSTEDHATPVTHSDRDIPSPPQAASDDTSAPESYRGSGSEPGPASPLPASGRPDSEALQLPEEVGNNGAETSVSRFPETAVLTRNSRTTNPGMREGTRGSRTSGRSAFPTVMSSKIRWMLGATPAGATETVDLQNRGRTSSSGLEDFRKLTSDPVWGSTWSPTGLPQRTTRLPYATEGPSRIAGSTVPTMGSGRIQNPSKLEDGMGMPRLTSTKTESRRVMNFGVSEDGMGTPGYSTQVGVLSLGGSVVGTSAPNSSPHVSTTLVSERVPDLSKDQKGMGDTPQAGVMNFGVSKDGMGTPDYSTQVGGSLVGTSAPNSSPHVSTILVSGGVPDLSKNQRGMRYTPQAGVLSLMFSEDGTGTPGQSLHPSTVMSSGGVENASSSEEGIRTAAISEDGTGTAARWSHVSTATASEGFLSLGVSQNETKMLGHSPGASEGRTGTPRHSLHVSTVMVSHSEDVTGAPQVGLLNLGGSQDGTATPENSPRASTILESGGVQYSSGAEAATLGHTTQVGVLASDNGTGAARYFHYASTVTVSGELVGFGGAEDVRRTSGHSPRARTVTTSGGVFGFGGSRRTDYTSYITPSPATLKNPASPSIPIRSYTTAAPPPITHGTLTTDRKAIRDENSVTTQQLIPGAQSASTPLSSVTILVPKVYVVPDQPAAVRVKSIELLLQIIVDDSSSVSGPDLEEGTSTWLEPYLQRAPGFSRTLGVWGRGRAVQTLLEFDSAGALRWLSASGASTLLRHTGLDEAARRGRSFRGSKVVNVTLGGVQADVCDWLLGCPAGFHCVSRTANNYSCSSVCHFDFCHHHGVCAHHPRQLPVCRCLVGEDFWFMGSRCDVRMTRARLVCTCASILALAVAVIGSLAFVAVRRYRDALIRAKVDQTRSSYRRFNHFDELSSRFWPRSASAASADSMDNPAFTRSDELLHMRALDRPCCYHDDTLSLASASASASSACTGRAARLNTVYPDSSQYGWRGSELSVGDGVLDSGKASDLSVCSWPVEPIHWTPFPLLRQLAAPQRPQRAVRTSRPRSYCEGMELVDMNRSWTA
ncbi:uncharacterized protein LOC144020973 [Festucalex cinctus]